jgi:hypothetical protein
MIVEDGRPEDDPAGTTWRRRDIWCPGRGRRHDQVERELRGVAIATDDGESDACA